MHVMRFWPEFSPTNLKGKPSPLTCLSQTASTMASLVDPSSYSAFIKSRIVDWDHGQGTQAVSVVQLTPLGASAAWCTELKTWGNSLSSMDANDVPKGRISRRAIIYHLFSNARDINDKLLRSLQALDWETRGAARNAFNVVGQLNEWFHDVIQTLIADRFIWAYRKSAGQDLRSFQVAHGVEAQRLTPKLEKFHGLLVKWRETVSNFLELWENSQRRCSDACVLSERSCPAVSDPHRECQLQNVLETLYTGVQESDLAKVENNFCRASLGLIALKLVCLLLSNR